MGIFRFVHRIPVLWNLHWLPICFWVQVKVLVAFFQVLDTSVSGYFQDHLLWLDTRLVKAPIIKNTPSKESHRCILSLMALSVEQLVLQHLESGPTLPC